jgi:hypothetical protein
MAALHAFRLLKRSQIEKLFGFGSTRRVNSRLHKLYDNQFLSRRHNYKNAQAIYFLGPKGVGVVSAELGEDPRVIRRQRKTVLGLKELFLAHALELSDIRIAFSQQIVNHPEMRLERWINDSDCAQTYRDAYTGKLKRFRPDGYFRFYFKNKLYSFFLELDRSTMSLKRFQNKVESYLEFARLGYYCERFGVKYFRVLVVAPTETRQDNLKKAVEQITSKVFWFTTLDRIRAKTEFTPIWKRAGQEGRYRLI